MVNSQLVFVMSLLSSTVTLIYPTFLVNSRIASLSISYTPGNMEFARILLLSREVGDCISDSSLSLCKLERILRETMCFRV